MYKTVKLVNEDLGQTLVLSEDSMIVDTHILEDIDWGVISATHKSVKFVDMIGAQLSKTVIGTRDVSITGCLVAQSEAQMLDLKAGLNKFINPFVNIEIQYMEYSLNFQPDKSVKYAKDSQQNNEILCRFLITGEAFDPMFRLTNSEIEIMQGLGQIPLFPIISKKEWSTRKGNMVQFYTKVDGMKRLKLVGETSQRRAVFSQNKIEIINGEPFPFVVGETLIVEGCASTVNNRSAVVTHISGRFLGFADGTFVNAVETQGKIRTNDAQKVYSIEVSADAPQYIESVSLPSRNLFNKSERISGKFLSPANVIGTTAYNNNVSLPIYIPPEYTSVRLSGHTYVQPNISVGAVWLDRNYKFVSGIDYKNATGNNAYTRPANGVYFQYTVNNTDLNTSQLELGNVATSYEAWRTYMSVTQYSRNILYPTKTFPFTQNGVTINYNPVTGEYTLNGTATGLTAYIREQVDATNVVKSRMWVTTYAEFVSGSVSAQVGIQQNNLFYSGGSASVVFYTGSTPGMTKQYSVFTNVYTGSLYPLLTTWFYFAVGTVFTDAKFKIQTEFSPTFTKYEPPALPKLYMLYPKDTSGNPLEFRGFGTYDLNGRLIPTIADVIFKDVDDKYKITSYTGKETISSGVTSASPLTNTVRFTVTVSKTYIAYDGSRTIPMGVSNYLRYADSYGGDVEHFYLSGNVLTGFISKSRLTAYGVDGINSFLATTPLVCVGTLAIPITTELHSDNQTLLNSIKALAGINNLSISTYSPNGAIEEDHYIMGTRDYAGVIFGIVSSETLRDVINTGDVETGINITLQIIGDVTNPRVTNQTSGQYIEVVTSKLPGGAAEEGDTIMISTMLGKKQITLLRGGVLTNILNATTLESRFFSLSPGNNTVAISAQENVSNVRMSLSFAPRFMEVQTVW